MTTLTRADFERLYLNANAIAEIAFLHAMDAAASAPLTEPTPGQRADLAAFSDKLNNPDPATFDWSALAGITGFGGAADAAPSQAAAAQPTFEDIVGWDELDDDADFDAPIDIARYLQRVEAARPQLQARIADGFARVDLEALAADLASLPGEPAPITSALAPEAFERWLALYERHHAGLEAAVLKIRALQPMFHG